MKSRWFAVALVSLLLVRGTGGGAGAQSATGSGHQEYAAAFLLKADPKWAKPIDNALAHFAQPIEVVVPSKTTPKEYVANLCADSAQSFHISGQRTEDGRFVVTMAPCVRVRRDVQVLVTEGDTLEGLAIRTGLPPAKAPSYRVKPAGNESPRLIAPKALQVGDVVVFPEVPAWTNVVTNPKVAPDRDAVVKAIADAIDCRQKDLESCLKQNGIELLNRTAAPFKPAVQKGLDREWSLTRAAFVPAASTRAGSPLSAWNAGNLDPTAVPVDPEQWPYDAKLLAEILRQSRSQMTARTVIGIADGGFRDFWGKPLSVDYFLPSMEQKSAIEDKRNEPNEEDDDENDWIDDFFGAGVPRVVPSPELAGSGDIALCKGGQPNFTSSTKLKIASHGTAVSSVAGARKLRQDFPDVASTLPQLLFFRMVAQACDDNAQLDVSDGELRLGFDYLVAKGADIINISYAVRQATGDSLTSRVKEVLPVKNSLLILPASNDNSNDLDPPAHVCPACLGHPAAGDAVARRTIVVGAATRDLHRADFSAFGEQTVRLFAPGDARDAIDLAGNALPAADASTSLAAPYVSLAAGIIRSFGTPNNSVDVRDRLEASTWPLDDAESNTERTGVGVVDLVKAAAARFYSVEVKEPGPDGSLVRRTYVGALHEKLHDLTICQGRAFRESSYHTIRLGDAAANGHRLLRLYPRGVNTATQRRTAILFDNGCKSSGQLSMKTVFGDEKVFQMSDVTYIQTPWYQQ